MSGYWAEAAKGFNPITAGLGLVGGLLSGKSAEKKAKREAAFKAKEDRALMADEAKYGAVNTLFQSKLEDYMSQLQRSRKQRGLDQFRSFSAMQQIAPGYSESGGIVVPQAPTIGDFNTQVQLAGISNPTKY